MIAGKQSGTPPADQVAARIAHVSDHGAVKAERASDQRRRHASVALATRHRRFQHVRVGFLHQARQQDGMRLPRSRSAKSAEHALHGGLRCDFSFLLPANAIGQSEKPTVRAHKTRRGWNDVPEIVLIVLADFSVVGKFGEFNLKHRPPVENPRLWVRGLPTYGTLIGHFQVYTLQKKFGQALMPARISYYIPDTTTDRTAQVRLATRVARPVALLERRK
jgi:hypothetical protein